MEFPITEKGTNVPIMRTRAKRAVLFYFQEISGMRKNKRFFKGIFMLGLCMVVMLSVKTFDEAIPKRIYLKSGESASYHFEVPVKVVTKDKAVEVSENSRNTKVDGARNTYEITCLLFGLFPVRDVEVVLVEEKSVYASGVPIGIYANTKGVLVIGTGSVALSDGAKECPAENILKPGDYIINVNGEKVDEKEQLQELVQNFGGTQEKIGLLRKNAYLEVEVEPVMGEKGNYMLGVWVKDDLAGIGTMTYYDGQGNFGALGHAISDGDTGEQLLMEEGHIYKADILGIKKGEKGNPGELSGLIEYRSGSRLGSITNNTEIGIYGKLEENIEKIPTGINCRLGYKQEIKLEKAYILSSIDGERKPYEIEIESLDFGGHEKNKGILFRVTDETLLSKTGGIVQGMSGSPILQNDKLIGAVTHVFVNDPTRGYGIFIENMVEAAK